MPNLGCFPSCSEINTGFYAEIAGEYWFRTLFNGQYITLKSEPLLAGDPIVFAGGQLPENYQFIGVLADPEGGFITDLEFELKPGKSFFTFVIPDFYEPDFYFEDFFV